MNAALEAARKKREEMRANGETVERLDPIEKAARNPSSLRAAVNGKCWDCQGAGADPGTRRAIRECPATRCPLWNVRPYQSKDVDE